MDFQELSIPGCYVVKYKKIGDDRGCFVKTHNSTALEDTVMGKFQMDEEFYSISSKNVLRGMHFQVPPFAHSKYVYCAQGEVLDVFLDIRKGSPTYGKYQSVVLNGEDPMGVFLPEGIAHGFLSVQDNTLLVYKTSKGYAPEFDTGIKWDSFGAVWPEGDHILSKRDESFVELENFDSPFEYGG